MVDQELELVMEVKLFSSIAEAGTSGSSLNSATAAVTITKGKALQIHPNTSSYTDGGTVDIDFSQIGDRIIELSTGGSSFSLTGSNATNVGQQGSIVLINPIQPHQLSLGLQVMFGILKMEMLLQYQQQMI